MFCLIIQGNVLREWKNYELMRLYTDLRNTSPIYVINAVKGLLAKNRSTDTPKCADSNLLTVLYAVKVLEDRSMSVDTPKYAAKYRRRNSRAL